MRWAEPNMLVEERCPPKVDSPEGEIAELEARLAEKENKVTDDLS